MSSSDVKVEHFDFGLANEHQRAAIQHTEGPLLIIAGPGTGKTFTLVKRIAYLVVEKKVKPSEIMVVTFTEKAGKELLTRISNEFLQYNMDLNLNEMYIGTFHSVCLRLLKEQGATLEFSKKRRVLDAFEQVYLVCRNIDRFNRLGGYSTHIHGTIWKQAMEICRYVNQMQEEMVDVAAMARDQDPDMNFLAKLVTRYQELLDQNEAMDFSSIQTRTYKMLWENPELLQGLQQKILYIMVDEYQDTNYIQEQLIFLLSRKEQNICVVGDDDQGMYRFRGATIRNILEFPKQFENERCQLIHLDINYRSEQEIINFYNQWMNDIEGINLFNWDKFRYEKKIIAGKSNISEKHAVFTCGGDSIEMEKEELYQLILRLKNSGSINDYNQIAFLFRSVKGSEAKEIASYLEERGIPVYSPRSELFFERKEVKQLLGCLMLCFQTYVVDLKKQAFRYSITAVLREYYIDCIKEAKEILKPELAQFINWINGKVKAVAEESDISLLDIFYRILSFEPFKTHLQADLQDRVTESRAARNLSEISRMLSHFVFLHDMHSLNDRNKAVLPEELFNIYLKYLIEDGVGEYEDESEYAPSGCISFMTIHQSKGLEFPAVVVGSLGTFPRKHNDPLLFAAESRFFHRRPFEPLDNIKYFDFWRLYYTAFSRAQNLLVLASKKSENRYFGDYLLTLPDAKDWEGGNTFETVKPVNYKRMYSFTSHISVYEDCPLQYKYYKEFNFAKKRMFHTSVGSLVHATLEDMNNSIIRGNLQQVNEQSIENWFALNYQSMQEETGYFLTDEQKAAALQQVLRYYKHRKDELGRVLHAEEEINLVLPEYILQGIIDLIEGDENSVEIVDYKTGPKPDIVNHPERVEHYRKQLEVYAYLIEKRYGKQVRRMHLYYTSTLQGNPLISFEWKQENIDRTIAELSETIRRIEAKDFSGIVNNCYSCDFCDMRYVCGKANATN